MNKALEDKIKELYPNPKCELVFGSPFELLVAVILSAQCTDKRVNEVTKDLFAVANTPKQFVDMPQEELERRIFSCGFYKNKARAIKEMSNDIVQKYDGKVPGTMEELTSLRGVGTKTASVVLAESFKVPAIAVDTHVFRVSNRLGIVHEKTPEKTHKKLLETVPKDFWANYHYSIVLHGRYVCKSQKPNCAGCGLSAFCEFYNKGEK